ncbi:MAG: ABC transporter permease [Candidatus Giovannonibacteria bacterium]|nr:MAG: ABC transporter permease [Candidatus Giovannonibacteria bacterium]
MTILDTLEETYTAVSANKARSGLTILGIIIGIASVIAMISIGEGARSSIEASIEGLGSNLLTILPGVVQPGRGIVSSGRGSAQTLTDDDLEVLERIDGIEVISPEVSRRFQISAASGNNTNTTVTGILPAYLFVRNLSLADGVFISDSNVRGLGRTAVLGATVAKDLFGGENPLGKSIRINNASFRVIGVLNQKGGFGFSGPDDMVLIPLSTMQKVVSGVDYLTGISISVKDKNRMTEVRLAAADALLREHRVSEPDFSIISQEDILGTLTQVVDTFTIFLASIAGISLVVGGIGIMNMMLTTVTERTREIGIRKAIGAKRRDITFQFLAEAIMLTFLGGFFGIVLGWLISLGVSQFAGIATSVSIQAILLAFGVSAAIGIIFGYYPARRAASLNPIEALRYE